MFVLPLGIDQGELLVQPGATGLQFLPTRSTVPRGAAFDGIADIEIALGLKADLHQQPVEGLAGSADEGLTGGVLARSWHGHAFGPLCYEIRREDEAFPGFRVLADALGCGLEVPL